MMDLRDYRIVLTGGNGFLGRHVQRALELRGVEPCNVHVIRSAVYDLTRADQVERMYAQIKPHVVIHLAGEVGGIGANQANPGRYFCANMAMGLNLIEGARIAGVRKFVQVGTVCSYPANTPVPFKEDNLWNGYPESTNAPYGVAKRAAFEMARAYHQQYGMAFACPILANLYGPGDCFTVDRSHVIPALIRKFAHAKGEPVHIWGDGSATREFLHVTDAAEAVVRCAEVIETPEPLNIGTSKEISIHTLAHQIVHLTGYAGTIKWDLDKPNGQQRRCLDTSRAFKRMGWTAAIPLEQGLRETVAAYWRENVDESYQMPLHVA